MHSIRHDWLEVSERLLARRTELAARLAAIAADRRRTRGALDPDFAEQAAQRENDEVLDALDGSERAELEAIEQALSRIDADCFGICDRCGRDIDPERLEALPAAATCRSCAETGAAAASG